MPHERFAAALNQARGYMSQAELARQVGVTRGLVNYWCKGRHLPTPQHRARLYEIFPALADNVATTTP